MTGTTFEARPARKAETGRPSSLITSATFLCGLAVVMFARWGPDWPAQEFRAGVAVRDGLLAWTDQWYAGQPLPGYSVLYPLSARVLGAAGTGVVAVTVATWAAGRLVPSLSLRQHRVYSLAVAIMLLSNLLIGQVPFLLGTAFGLCALVALFGSRTVLTLLLAAACSLASPLAGAFLLLGMLAFAGTVGWRRAGLLASALTGLGVSAFVGGAGGPFPCPWSSLVGVLGFSLVAWLISSRADQVLRRFAVLYALAGLLCFFIPNPIGGNITRLGKLIALPLACYLISTGRHRSPAGDGWKRHRLAGRLMTMVVPALIWPLVPMGSAIAHGATDPSQHDTYYQGLLGFLKTQDPAEGRLEIPFTREHWESSWVASAFPLARGWERQTDLQYNAVLYQPLTAATYEQWLEQNAVGLIALPNVPLDDGGKAEATLLAHPLPYLTSVWSDQNWHVWKVDSPHPLISPGATISNVGPASFQLQFSQPGSVLVRIRSSRLWQVTSGQACLSTSADGWLQVQAASAGTITIRARLNMQLVTGVPDCDLH